MPYFTFRRHTVVALLLACVSTSIGLVASAQQRVNVAIVTDGPQYQLEDVEAVFRRELRALTDGEFELSLFPLVADWTIEGVESAMNAAYADPAIDMVLVLGIAANQLSVGRSQFPKPTFLPLVFNPSLLGAPVAENRSGRKNLNYLADRVAISEDLASFQRIIPFKSALLITDALIFDSLPTAPVELRRNGAGIEFSFLSHDGSDHDLLAKLPAGVDAILLGGLPRMPSAAFDSLLEDIAQRGLPTFSLVGATEVHRGALASDAVETDYARLARRNALNMQAVMLGELAQDQPVYFDGKRQLTLNMDTARKIGLSPRFDVLTEAELVNAEATSDGPQFDLKTVARLALEKNLELQAQQLDLALGEQDVLGARANLLPQISVGGGYTARRSNALIRGPGTAQRSSSAAVGLSQLVYSDSASSGYQQQKLLQKGRAAALSANRLNSVLEATVAYLQALRAGNQFSIQQDNLNLTKSNLELARDRVRVGSASNADIYRWEANLASARSAVLLALAARQQARENLNRVLNRPVAAAIRLATPSKGDPFTMQPKEFDELIDNPRSFSWFIDFGVAEGLANAPELVQLQAQIDATERDITAKRRAYWLPSFTIDAQYADSLDASGLGSGSAIDQVNDWNVSLNGSLPLFSGGARRAGLTRAQLQRQQLVLSKAASSQRIEQDIRATLHSTRASYQNIEFSEQGALAARKNLELVSDAYGQGTLSIIDLLDAQNQSLQAELAANNAVHDFLIDVMNFQRAIASFDFLLTKAEQTQRNQQLRDYLETRAAGAPGSIQ